MAVVESAKKANQFNIALLEKREVRRVFIDNQVLES
jgi:hypothetical protein